MPRARGNRGMPTSDRRRTASASDGRTLKGVDGTPKPEAFSLEGRARSFRPALRGLARLLCTQHNAWIHAAATLAVAGAGLLAGLSRGEWALLVLAMAAVWCAEALNTAVETLGGAVSPEHDDRVGLAKDVAAGAVLVAALGAAVVGGLVFWPHVQRQLGWIAR
jgi:diacylglycerol kinase (ATP)